MALKVPSEVVVAAVLGRLHAMRGRVNVPANPEFGAFRHVAGTVLLATAADPSLRAALNLRSSDALPPATRDAGFQPRDREFDASYEDRADALAALFDEYGVPRGYLPSRRSWNRADHLRLRRDGRRRRRDGRQANRPRDGR